MTTTKPRITVTLEPETATRLKRISQLTGNSQSSMISEVLDQAGSVFDRLILVLEAAETAKSQIKRSSVDRLVEAQNLIERQLGLVLDCFEHGGVGAGASVAGGDDGSGATCRDAPAARVGAPLRGSTPLSNRGVRSTTDAKKTNTKRASDA